MIKSKPLYPYHERVNKFANNKARVGLFVYYGGGKTYLSLQWLQSLIDNGRNVFPVVILMTKTLLEQWPEEIETHSDFKYLVIEGTKRKRLKTLATKTQLYLCTYDAIRSDAIWGVFKATDWIRTLITDESTAIKEKRTLRFERWYNSITRHVPFRAILSGKPMTEEELDIWAQSYWLDDGLALFRSFWKFRYTFFREGPPWKPYDWVVKQGAAAQIAKRLSVTCIAVSKKEVQAELPPRQDIDVKFSLSKADRRRYKDLQEDFEWTKTDGEIREYKYAMARATKMHQLCQGWIHDTPTGETIEYHSMKLDWIKENIPIMLTNSPVLIWTAYIYDILRLSSLFIKLDILHSTVWGDKPKNTDTGGIAEFKAGKTNLMVMGIQKCHKGLNLQRAGQAVLYNSTFSAEERENLEMRCFRTGSQIHDQITYYHLLVRNSADMVVETAYKEKYNITEAVLRHLQGE